MFDRSKIPQNALTIIKTLKDKGYQAYLVGGCVRDLLLGNVPEEWDITTDALPEEVGKMFNKVIPTGIEFGTVTVLLKGQTFEVTTFRREEKYTDGRHPEKVAFAKNLTIDLSRRDFTINAMAYDPEKKELIDLFRGQEDLKNKAIRAVGVPVTRFKEDGLRPLRACRFAAKLEFKIEKKTFEAIKKTLNIAKQVALERVHDEITKMLSAQKPSIGFEYMHQSGLLELYIPELLTCVKVDQPQEFHKFDVYWHSLYSMDAAPVGKVVVRMAALLHDIAKPQCKVDQTFYNHDKVGVEITEKILKRLKFSNADIQAINNLINNHMFDYKPEWTDPAVRRFIKRVGYENLEDLFALRRADTEAMKSDVGYKYLDELRRRIKKIIDEEHALHIKDLKVDGKDVMRELNLKPGPKVGRVLESLMEKVLEDPKLNQREKLLELIRAEAK